MTDSGATPTSRRTILRTVVVLGACAAGATSGSASAATPARFADDFTAVPDGPLDGRTAPTGHRWRAFGVGERATMVVNGRAAGAPPGHVAGAGSGPDAPGAAAGYGIVDIDGRVGAVEAEYRWDISRATTTGLAFGAFAVPTTGEGFPATAGGASAHVGITPTLVEFAVFSRGVRGDFTVLTPEGADSGTVRFDEPQLCDGRTRYRARVTLSGDRAVLEVDGLPRPLRYRDPRIASVPAASPFWEYYSTPRGTNLPRFVRVAARRA